MMSFLTVSPPLAWLLWTAAAIAALASLSLTIGLSLLLGTVSYRRVALPMVWVSTSLLTACVVAVVLVLVEK